MARRVIVLHTALAPDAVMGILRCELREKRTLFPLAGIGGSGFVGRVHEKKFRVRKQGFASNEVASQFYGRIEADPNGTRIMGYFDFPGWMRLFMWIWLGLAIVVGLPIFVQALMQILKAPQELNRNLWVGLVASPVFLLYALLLPRIGRYLGRGGERILLEFLEKKLEARGISL